MCHILIREALENEHESFALDKSAEGSQFFFDLLEYPPDTLGQWFHLIRADMVGVNITDDMPKPSVRIKLLASFL